MELSSVFWNTTFQVIARVVSAIATLIITILIARQYGTAGYGDFTKITTYIAFFYLLSDFGFNAIYLQRQRHASPALAKRDEAWGTLFALRLIVSGFLMCFALALLAFIPQGVGQGYTQIVRLGIILFTPSILFQALITTTNAAFQKHLRYDLATIASAIGSIASLFLIWGIMVTPSSDVGIALEIFSLLIGSLVTVLVGFWFTKKIQGGFFLFFDTAKIASFFWASVPLGLTLLFNLIYFHVDSVILTITRPTADVGIYGLAYKVFELPLVVPTFFMNALYPILLKKNDKDFFKLLIKSILLLVGLSLIILGVLWEGAPFLTIIKPEFIKSVQPLRILVIGLPFFFASSGTMWALIAMKKQIALAYLYGTSMLINIGLNAFYIPKYGYVAASWITVVSEGIVVAASVATLAYFQLKKRGAKNI